MLRIGFALWFAATIVLRVGGSVVVPGRSPSAWLFLYAVSAIAMALVSRALCDWRRVPPADRAAAVTALILPTLILDPFSALFYSHVFPNLDPASAGAFGGWMLACCAGAVLGVRVRQ
jgi:Family of unknown function (DUF5367)